LNTAQDPSPAKTFNLDNLAMLWEEFRKRHARHKADKKWLEEFKATLKKVSDNAEEFKLNGSKVAALQPGNLNISRLDKEQPDVVAKYTHIVAEQKFDTEWFRTEEPELFEQYRAKALVLTNEPSFEGLE
jgi:hypothetical protein